MNSLRPFISSSSSSVFGLGQLPFLWCCVCASHCSPLLLLLLLLVVVVFVFSVDYVVSIQRKEPKSHKLHPNNTEKEKRKCKQTHTKATKTNDLFSVYDLVIIRNIRLAFLFAVESNFSWVLVFVRVVFIKLVTVGSH